MNWLCFLTAEKAFALWQIQQ